MSREKPYLPGINSPKISVHITVPVETTDKEVRKLVEKKQKEKIALHLVNIANSSGLETNELKTSKQRPPQ